MQLKKKTSTLRPLTVAAGLLSMTTAYAYSDVDAYSRVFATNSLTNKYVNTVDNNDSSIMFSKAKFDAYLQNWKAKTFFRSSVYDIVDDIDFKAIVAMGKQAVPYIKEELEREPSTLVWALNYIFGTKISDKPDLTITEACKLWTKTLSNV